ncbi:MAG TPA: dTDP-4-dehydrorhamnose 3,5-epimerase family protein [Actinomycetota bacterium]|nr:dTDP-4-dehydrorhamnose 3,5-epimerase family protein [Actinomycetota bacterium]
MRSEDIAGIPGAKLFYPQVHADSRGSFLEIFREDELGLNFVQANHSSSVQGVLRGLHYHREQSDAWYAMNGRAQAVLADLRTRSEAPAVVAVDLVAGDPKVLYIPPGVAHGFLAVTDVDLIYWVTGYYDSTDEFGVAWDDPTLNAPWKLTDPILSERDQSNPKLDWDSISL